VFPENANISSKRIPWIWIWLAMMLLVTAIIQPWSLYFQNDDFIYVSKAPLGNYLYRTAFRPVSDLTLRLDYFLYGKNGGGFHVSNLLFHFLASVMLFFTARKWQLAMKFEVVSNSIPHLAGLLFLLYPFHSESLLWTIGRGGSLVTILFLGALNLLLSQPLRWQHWLGAVVAFVAGLFTYESIWLLPLAATLVVWLKNDRKKLPAMDQRGLLALWGLLLVSFAVRKMLINDFVGSPYLNTTHFELSLHKQLYKYASGFCRSFLPPIDNSQWFLVASLLLVPAVVFILFKCIKQSNKKVQALSPFLLFLITLLPVSILAVNTHTTESERFLYLPSAFLCLQAAYCIITMMSKSWRWAIIIALGVYFAFFLNSAAQQFRLAGEWNKTALEEIGKHKGHYNTVHVIGLPTSYKGAFMFRLGFGEALQWISPQVQYDTLIIHSNQTIIKADELQIIYMAGKEMEHLLNQDSTGQVLYIFWKGNFFYTGTGKH
jgi:hypothetical protein